MGELLYNTAGISSYAGAAETINGTMDVEPFTMGYLDYSIPGGIEYSITLSNVGDAVVLTGNAHATIDGNCVRCLEPASMEIESDIEGYFANGPESDLEGLEDDEYEFIPDDGIIDLYPNVLAAIVVEIPPVFLCKDDCKGLCPTCGCNLNYEKCDCSNKIDETNPFAVLKDFFKDESEDAEDTSN